jgi:hypothetical protein
MSTKPKLASSESEGGQSDVKTYTITPNSGSDIQVGRGFHSLDYFESLFDNTVRAESVIVDASGPTGGDVNIVDKAQLQGGEKVVLSLEDGYKETLDVELYIKNHNYTQDVKGVVVDVSMWSKECIENEDTANRVIKKYKDILVSDMVSDIVSTYLKTDVNTDDSLGKQTFTGNYEKGFPFMMSMQLAKRCVPNASGAKGTLAGYLFYQTVDGYQFRSIDKLFEQEPKLKVIYDEIAKEKLPEGYDAKILSYKFNTSMDVEKMMKGGTFSKSEITTVDQRKNEYKEQSPFDSNIQNLITNNAGLEIPTPAAILDFANRSFLRKSRIKDTGQLKPIKKSDEANVPIEEIERQAKSRYNQIATSNLRITIPLNFKLRAGDMIEVDFPEPSSQKTVKVSKRKSGRYLIESLRHRIAIVTSDPVSNITVLSLVRDTEGKK